jgi:sugar phosphate isomerase/epimerase
MDIGIALSPNRSQFGPLLYSGDLNSGIRNASSLGYSGVELSLLDSAQIDAESVSAALEKSDLRAFAIATGQSYYTDGYSLYNPDAESSKSAVVRVRRHIDLAVRLACMVIIGGIRGKILGSDTSETRAAEENGKRAIASCIEYAERKAVTLLLEPINRYETNIINTVEEGLQFIRDFNSSCFKLLPDTFHMNIEERSISESILHAGSSIGYIHFADSNRLAPGWGHIDFADILEALRKVNYAGPIGIEVLPKPDDDATARQAIRHLEMLIDE